MQETREFVRTVTSKGQVTIPVEIRQLLEISPGDQVLFRVTESKVELQPAVMTLEDTFGAVTPLSRPENFARLREIAIEEHVQKVVEGMRE